MKSDPLVNPFLDREESLAPQEAAQDEPGELAEVAVLQRELPAENRWLAALVVVSIYVAVISMAAMLWRQPLLLTALYTPLAGFVLYRWWSIETLACFLTGFVLGPAGEFVAVSAGAWSYAGHERLPLWLPLAWGIAVVVMKQIVVLVGVWRARA